MRAKSGSEGPFGGSTVPSAVPFFVTICEIAILDAVIEWCSIAFVSIHAILFWLGTTYTSGIFFTMR